MRQMRLCLAVLWIWGLVGGWVDAAEFKLSNGNIIRGEIASADDDGLVVRLEVGGYSPREPWINFSQETLRALATDAAAREFVEPFIEPTPEELAREIPPPIRVREVTARLDRPEDPPGLIAGFMTPFGIALLAILMLANIYAAYEVALFREQPVPLVCALAVLMPLIAQIVFLTLPARGGAAPAAEEPLPEVAGAGRKTTSIVAEKPVSGLSLAATHKAGPASAAIQPQVYQRGEHTFNRRFFETKFPGFFRVVPSEAEKDLVLVIRGVKNEYVGRRVSRISMNELHLQLLSGSSEVTVPFAEITSVIVRHKDARA